MLSMVIHDVPHMISDASQEGALVEQPRRPGAGWQGGERPAAARAGPCSLAAARDEADGQALGLLYGDDGEDDGL